jgi:spore germination cell wall hydrolase CwlJ-like protein
MKWLLITMLFLLFSSYRLESETLGALLPEEDELIIIDLPPIEIKSYRESDLILLARLVNSEDGGQPFLSNAVVAQTVISKAKRYGSIHSAVYKTYTDKSGKVSYAYYGVLNSAFKKYPPPHIIEACEMVLKGWRPAPESVEYFIGDRDPDGKWKRHISKYAWKQIGYHTYCHNPKKLALP